MKKVAVILSGAGRFDGSEIHESVAGLLAIDRAGANYHCFALDKPQTRVTNHYTEETTTDSRNILAESARIARELISPLSDANPAEFDAAFYPGGFGAALNLCDFGVKGADCQVDETVAAFSKVMTDAGKPQGFACIAPVLIPKLYPHGVKLTIGHDPDTAKAIEAMGGVHIECDVRDAVFDAQYQVASTPAYMLAQRIDEVFEGIGKCIELLLK